MTRRFPYRIHRIFYSALALLSFAGIAAPAWAQFETRATNPLPPGAFSVAAGDFDHDGKLDIVVVDDNGFSVSLGDGDGTFQKAVSYAASGLSIAAGDFNNDGNIDLVMANGNNSVSVYLGNGDGTFQSPKTTATTEDCRFVAVGDFNNDRKLDVVVVGFFGGSDNIGVLLGNGDGTLQDSITDPLTYVPQTVSTGDFDGDGNLDAAIADKFSGVTVLLGDGKGGFGPQTLYETTSFSGGPLVVSDLNLDGKTDLAIQSATANNHVGGVDVFWGNGDGTFQQAPDFFGSGLTGLAVLGDFNNDHLPDIVLANELSAITVLNTGLSTFSPSTPLAFGTVLINTTSPPKTVTLTNRGTAALSIRSIRTSGQFEAKNTCGNSVAAGATCEFTAVFAPKAAGSQTGTIAIIDGASSKPQVIELSGRGTHVGISPDPLKFGPQKIGTTSPPQQLAITNDGGTGVIFFNIGTKTKDFAVTGTSSCTNQQLLPGATCYVTVTFTPQKVGALAAVVIVNDNAEGGFQTSTLTGTGK